MVKRIVLNINSDVINKAKSYAKSHNTNLSELVEAMLKNRFKEPPTEEDKKDTPIVNNIAGIVELDESFNEKDEYIKHLEKKYK